MPITIKSLRAISGMGILASRDRKTQPVQFRRYNLLYGFNGSGKSTLSRMFASFQAGALHGHLPAGSTFEIELSDGAILTNPDKLNGLERNVLVFNADFVEQNLQWSNARANPVFYIGKEQAALADELAANRNKIPSSVARVNRADSAVRTADKDLVTFRRERAREISDQLRLRGRKYEAPQLSQDYAQITLNESSLLDDAALDAVVFSSRQDTPPATVDEVAMNLASAASAVWTTRGVCEIALSTTILSELQAHPDMLIWVMQGHEYHSSMSLKDCLFCNNPISVERMDAIKRALEGSIDKALAAIDSQRDVVNASQSNLQSANPPNVALLNASHAKSYAAALTTYSAALESLRSAYKLADQLLETKRKTPGTVPDASGLPTQEQAETIVQKLGDAQLALNAVISSHNQDVENFARLQDEARLAIRTHYLAKGHEEYNALQTAQADARSESEAANAADAQLRVDIQTLENKIRQHGPAADAINRLLYSYLGHSELSIAPVQSGYEIHRNGNLIKGVPSEGEKTAIALSYFLSTIESDGRKSRDLIVVIDDPISSLDSRSLNFACNLIKSRLNTVAQLFLLTHNQNCLNEFRKPWKAKARPQDGTEPTAALFFLDVSMPVATKFRTSAIVELPALLREYDSVYHYLFHHVLKFVEIQGEYDHAYMMPNVLRRVLEVFLAFRCPGSSGLQSKIDQLCKVHENLDRNRLLALERLSQVESHSDNLDDLISFSSMTLEETRDATQALLTIMETVDASHLVGLRGICA